MWKGKHIVIVGPAHPLRGGLATYNERLARELMLHNKVTLLTFSLQYPNFLFPGESQYSSDPKPTDLDIDIQLNSINPINWILTGNKYKKNQTRYHYFQILDAVFWSLLWNIFPHCKRQWAYQNGGHYR